MMRNLFKGLQAGAADDMCEPAGGAAGEPPVFEVRANTRRRIMQQDFRTKEGKPVTIAPETHDAAKKLANKQGVKLSVLADQAVREYLKDRKGGKKFFRIF